MPLPSARRKPDPVKGVTAEISDCFREIAKKRRELEKLEDKLQGLLDKHLDLVGRITK